jgi:hypothetical protein
MKSGAEQTNLQGALTFGRDANLTIRTVPTGQPGAHDVRFASPGYLLKISGPLDGPRMSAEKAVASLPAD